MIRRTFLGTVVAALSLLGVAQHAQAQKSADNLRIVFRDALTNIDPYYNQLRVGIVLHHMAWDGLVYRDPDTFKVVPLLATEWKQVDPLTLDFTLRQGVKFHDGSSFTADDAVYTINLVSSPDSKVSTPSNYSWIDHAEKTGDYAIRVKFKKPTPAALDSFALVVPMYPKAYREKVGAEAYAKAPIGAGPYKVTSVEPGVSATFERFDGYWAGSPKGKAAIKNISVRYVPDAATEMTELLAQRADWIWQFNPDQAAGVNRMPNLQTVFKESMRIGFLSIDAAGRSGADNPLTKQKVRQAIWYAIDRQTIADKLVTNGSRVPLAPCYPTQFGCDGDAAVKYTYDPAKAKALLAEAGYPNGFDIDFVSYMLPAWEAAVQNYLQAVGIKANLQHMQVQAAIERINKGQAPLNFGSWGSYSINDVSAILPNYFTFGDADYARDPEVKRLLEEGGATNDAEKRHQAYAEALKRMTEQAYWLPMFTYTTSYAYTKSLEFTPYSDELPRFYLCKWK
jgi:peptide/nickel transport system substrate-binding protein